jgi:hypothetical protein
MTALVASRANLVGARPRPHVFHRTEDERKTTWQSISASMTRIARAAFRVADAADDQPTADLLTQRMEIHEKNAWMLRVLLEDGGDKAAATAKKRNKK